MKNKKYYAFIMGGMMGALALSQICITVFFPTRSPLIRSNLTSYFSQKTSDFLAQAGNLIPKFTLPSFTSSSLEENSTTAIPTPSTEIFTPGESAIASGVRQQLDTQKLTLSSPGIYITNNTSSYLTVLKQNEASWIEYSVNVNGNAVKIRAPSGQKPPSSEVLSQMY